MAPRGPRALLRDALAPARPGEGGARLSLTLESDAAGAGAREKQLRGLQENGAVADLSRNARAGAASVRRGGVRRRFSRQPQGRERTARPPDRGQKPPDARGDRENP